MKKWEYMILDSVVLREKKIISATLSFQEFERFINDLGREGWEIINLDYKKIGHDLGSFQGLAKRSFGQ